MLGTIVQYHHLIKPTVCACLFSATLATAAAPAPPLRVPVLMLASAPRVDGDLGEWGNSDWIKLPITPALSKADRAKYGLEPNDDKNQTGNLDVQMKAGVFGSRFYLAFKYPDSTEDATLRQWEWRGEKYVESKQYDDLFAVRFHMSGDFDRSMLTTASYAVDVWLWSAARTNPNGLAEDMSHQVSTKPIENAAEFEPSGAKTIYIKKSRDAGTELFSTTPKPKANKGDRVPLHELVAAKGSSADVAAKGRWKSGYWQLEFGRALNTGNADDVVLKPGLTVLGQIAVFNQGYAEHKSVSEPLLFDFSALK